MKQKSVIWLFFPLFFLAFLGLSFPSYAGQPPNKISTKKINPKTALKMATEAYIYGYPLVTMEMTRRVMTNTAEPTALKAPMGQFANAREYPNASFKDVTAPNADTLYSAAWLDLTKEPYILRVPDEHGRYYLMSMLSAWTNVTILLAKTSSDKWVLETSSRESIGIMIENNMRTI